ncbi:alpha-1,3-mannosyl-glycoprotein 2-beta-N-acetylglucosaminyltransferase-like [Watersipora subatra]|uniref:alpha-1,3-mannosyl-glycoprotein 2-beta-N-acetylglucosaminyltransferase-like n=1 Tax=Watersipora subatra TaxID=2589382 RepID=UPI00355AE394
MALSAGRVLFTFALLSLCLLIINLWLMAGHEQPNPSALTQGSLETKLAGLSEEAIKQATAAHHLELELSQLKAAIKQGRAIKVTLAKPQFNQAISTVAKPAASTEEIVLPILVFACNRPEAIVQALDDLLKYRPSKEKFPLIVTRDCNHEATRLAVDKYKDVIHRHLVQPDSGEIPNLDKKEKKMQGYFKISRHYKWALGQIFDVMKYKAVIVMEDDLNIASDFYEYFAATYPLLKTDPTLYCVSAWNDNGKASQIEDNPELLYRSDFFPGLGWMMLDTLWDEYRDVWPRGFWDDWIRQEDQRHGRSCIRPEISRTHTFGEKGVSLGLFYKTHLKFIVLNEKPVEWTKMDLSYLKKEKYDESYTIAVYNSPIIPLSDLKKAAEEKTLSSVRITYDSKVTFKALAKQLNIMNDFKDGIPRTAYRGILPIVYNGLRVYLTPESEWKKYDPSWT